VRPSPLFAQLHLRSVNRGHYQRRPLTAAEKAALVAAAGDGLEIDWFDSLTERWKIARLSGMATDIRLRAPEAFRVHQQVIDWNHAYSATGLPSRALGLSKSSLPLMRWAMHDWRRMSRFNRLTGTLLARLQLDYLPALASGAFFVTRVADRNAESADHVTELLRVGQSVQRFWLRATQLGLAMQPELAILAFADHGMNDIAFSSDAGLRAKARVLATEFPRVLGHKPANVVFIGRIGEAHPGLPRTRSIRRRVDELVWPRE
jgi:hypothetical protein